MNLQEKIEELNLLLVSYRLVLADKDSTIKDLMKQIEELKETIQMYDRDDEIYLIQG